MAPYKRKIKLIKPKLQLKLTMIFVGFSALSLLLQFVLFTSSLTEAALLLPQDGALLMEETSGLLMKVILTSCFLFLPLIFMVGVLTTFRIAGPIYSFERFINQVLRGENPRDIKLRTGDELHEFAELLNKVTIPLRNRHDSEDASPAHDVDEAQPLVADTQGEAQDAEVGTQAH